jgi:hypothetical protein
MFGAIIGNRDQAQEGGTKRRLRLRRLTLNLSPRGDCPVEELDMAMIPERIAESTRFCIEDTT